MIYFKLQEGKKLFTVNDHIYLLAETIAQNQHPPIVKYHLKHGNITLLSSLDKLNGHFSPSMMAERCIDVRERRSKIHF